MTRDFYNQLQAVLDQTPKKDIIIVQGDWNAKVGEDAYSNWKDTCGPYGNNETNDRGLRLLEFARYNNLLLVNTLGPHKASRRWTWHSPGGEYHNQIDYILVQKRFRSSVNTGGTRSFPKADIGSDHDLVLMSFRLRLKKIKSSKCTRMKFDLDKLRDPEVAEALEAWREAAAAAELRAKAEQKFFALIAVLHSMGLVVLKKQFDKLT